MSGIMSLIETLGPWTWFILAVVLLSMEFVIPGVHFLWFGLAAVVVGVIAMSTVLAWPWQVAIYAFISIVSVFWVRRFVRPASNASDVPALNERGAHYLGRTVPVEDAIQGGRGKVRVGDTVWAASGPDAPAGALVRVVGAKGTVLEVERA
jgi:membrane protein implicated in regulation of membrane protease activity